jgi:protein tyrosine/serine phosphatase
MHTALGALADASSYPIFVHCKKGLDRTGVVIALHRVFDQGWSPQDARAEMYALGFDMRLWTLRRYFEKAIGH